MEQSEELERVCSERDILVQIVEQQQQESASLRVSLGKVHPRVNRPLCVCVCTQSLARPQHTHILAFTFTFRPYLCVCVCVHSVTF